MRFTPEEITSLAPDEIFVFGSNLAGRHGKGAALVARQKFGCRQGCGHGRCGQTYAIPTKDELLRPLSVYQIDQYVYEFLEYAKRTPELTFLVTPIGCGLAGYNAENIAPLFFPMRNTAGLSTRIRMDPPRNVILPQSFWSWRCHENMAQLTDPYYDIPF